MIFGGLYIIYKKLFQKRKLRLLENLSFQGLSLIVQLLFTLPVGLDMVGKNTLINDRPPPAAADRLRKTMNSGSPQTQKSENEDISQTHKRYHFQNCGTVYMDSRDVGMVTIFHKLLIRVY